jgi:hypothetical protein
VSSTTAQRPADAHRGLRRDARRNYERILDAARQASGDDVSTLISAMRGLIHTVPDGTPRVWRRFLDLHLAGMTAPPPPEASARSA